MTQQSHHLESLIYSIFAHSFLSIDPKKCLGVSRLHTDSNIPQGRHFSARSAINQKGLSNGLFEILHPWTAPGHRRSQPTQNTKFGLIPQAFCHATPYHRNVHAPLYFQIIGGVCYFHASKKLDQRVTQWYSFVSHLPQLILSQGKWWFRRFE